MIVTAVREDWVFETRRTAQDITMEYSNNDGAFFPSHEGAETLRVEMAKLPSVTYLMRSRLLRKKLQRDK